MTNTKIAILVGAGAVENAWEPILTIYKQMNDNETDADSANFLIAKSICALRLYSKLPTGEKQLIEELESVELLKEIIGESLKLAQQKGILKPRKEFETILNNFVFDNPNNLFGFVSTNWDTVIDEEAERLVKQKYSDIEHVKVFHIHGSIEEHQHLYLPTETSQENYRTADENKKLGLKHFSTLKFLKEANRIILYGISLDPLDAELNLLLSANFTNSNNIKEVIIINPEYLKISKRVKLLLYPRKDVTIRCFHPVNLDKEVFES